MATPFDVQVVTPERILYTGEAEEVSMRTEEGEISFLARHEDFIGAIDVTVVRITTTGTSDADVTGEVRLAVAGGFVHVNQDSHSVTILAGVAELGSEIDVERARAALAAAEAAVGQGGTTPGQSGQAPSGESSGDGESAIRPSGALLALLDPDAPEVAAKRARIRLEAAGAALSG